MKNCITINTKKDEIIIRISENAEQSEILECLKEKLIQLKQLYKDENTPITVTGKVLKNREIDEIQKLIKSNINVSISFESPRSLGLHGIKKTYSKDTTISETKYLNGSLRSGQRIEFEGSIVVIGDVNDGAEVVAGENIIILGILRGLAHAGAKGNKDGVIAANAIEASQIRIANIVREREKEEIAQKKIKYAFIKENKMILQ